MKHYFSFLLFLLLQHGLRAQPYLDVAGVRYRTNPAGGILRQSFAQNKYTYASAGVNLPLVLKDSSILMWSPALECWQVKSRALPQVPNNLRGIALPLTFVKPLSTVWTATVLAIPRWNGAEHFGFENNFQMGGAVLMARKKAENLTYKFGVYYNREAFGHFVMPLLGIDWRPLPTLRVFGVLPGNAVVEKKVSKAFYYGLSFRAVTTSYSFSSPVDLPSFIRIDDNTVQAFADLYFTKNIVLNAELGHSLFRRFRVGYEDASEKYFIKEKFNDGPLARLSLLYRIRFDTKN
jgi:hypothetical protein